MQPLNLAILGTGNIARQVVQSAPSAQRVRVTAVGSRNPDSARSFVAAHGLSSATAGTYDAVLADPAVQAVYISLPNSLHHKWTLKALRAGKHVLCEKPLTPTLAQAEELFDAADRAGRLLVEAFMYRSHPQTREVVAAVQSGRIGTLRHIRTSFCYLTRKITGNVRFDPTLAGGALLDIGCYCIDFTCLLAGATPTAAYAVARKHPTGVDEQVAGLLQFPSGLTATFTCGMTLQADNTATISGDEGYIEVPVPWKPPSPSQWVLAHSAPPKMDSATATAGAVPPRTVHTVTETKPLYALELDDFARAVAGEIAPAMPRADTLRNLKVIDAIRRQIA